MFAFDSPWIPLQRRRAAAEVALQERILAAEEARLRSQMERNYRLRASKKKEDKERQEQEYIGFLQQRQQEEQQQQQQQAYEEARLRRATAQAKAKRRQQDRQFYHDGDSDDEEVEEFSAVCGPHGQLYRVRNPSFQAKKNLQLRQASRPIEPRLVRGPDGNLYRVESPRSESHVDMDTLLDYKENLSSFPWDSSMKRNDMDDVYVEEKVENKVKAPASLKAKSKNGKDKKEKKIAVVVEDASDSEYNDEYKSPWRNRRPSPGQWMEPVESFQ
jgi:hypothetical protein